MLPAYLPFLFAGVFALDRFLSYERRRRTAAGKLSLPATGTFIRQRAESMRRLPWITIIATLPLCLWLGYSAVRHIHEIEVANTQRHGYEGARWVESEVLEYLRAASAGRVIFTNDPSATYIHTDYRAGPAGHRFLRRDLRFQLARRAADGDYVVWFDNGIVDLPLDYDAGFLRTLPELRPVAQLSDGSVFEVDKSHTNALAQWLAAIGEPAMRATFDLYLVDRTLVYVKEDCRISDTEARFFLHVIPARRGALPDERQSHGFDNRDFSFAEHGWIVDWKCVVTRELPAYPVNSVRTGQFVRSGDPRWQVELPVNE